MIDKQSPLIKRLKDFLQYLSNEDYAMCRKKAQVLKKSIQKWESQASKCTEKLSGCQKQIKKLQEENKKYFDTIKSRNPKSNQIEEKIKNGRVLKQERNESSRLQVLYLLQVDLYGQAFKQSKQPYLFLQRLLEYECLAKIWETVNEQKIEEPDIKSEFYRHVKKILINDAKNEQQFKHYASKISKGERLQPYERPKHLSKGFYDILLNMQQNLKNPIYYEDEEIDQKNDSIVMAIQILKQIYRQFFQKQLNLQTLQTISLQRLIKELRSDLNKWKQRMNQQKYLDKDQAYLQRKVKLESLIQRNQYLEKLTKKNLQSLIKIVAVQICIGDHYLYPANEDDTQDIINCIAENTQKLINQKEDLQKQTILKKTQNKQSQIYFDEKLSPLYQQQRFNYQKKITVLEQKQQKLSSINATYKKKIEQLQIKIDKVEGSLQEKNKQYNNILLQLSESQQQINKFESRLKKQSGFIRQKQIKQNELLKSILVLKDQKKSPQVFMQSHFQYQFTNSVESNNDSAQIQKLKSVIEELKKEQSEIIIRYDQLLRVSKQKQEKSIQSLKYQKQRYQKLKLDYDQLEERLNAQSQHLKQTHQINSQLELQFNQMKSRSKILNDPLQNNNKGEVVLNSQLEINLKQQIDIKQQQLSKCKRQKIDLKNRVIQLQDRNKKLIKQQQARIQKFKMSQRQYLQNAKRDLEMERQNHLKTHQQLAKTQSQLLQISQKTQIYQSKNQSLTKQISLRKETQSARIQPSNLYITNLFNFKGIFEESQQRQHEYLIKTLESHYSKIQKAKLLYFYDPLNKTNFHRYVDNHKNLLVIVKTLFGKLIAGFSQVEINPKGSKVGFGLVMSLWKQCTFQILPDKKPVTYDDYYIIFGNSQIRLRSQQDKVFSNFGISNGFYRAGTSKIEDLLGERERQVDIIGYEFYEVIFS